MKKLLLPYIALLLSHIHLAAQDLVSIENATAGTLKDKINSKVWETYHALKISGPLNAEDIAALKTFAMPDSGKLAEIDLSQADMFVMGDEAFAGCENLKKIKLPSSIKGIGKSAFGGCINLSEIELPQNLVTLGEYAFADCRNLESILLPAGIKIISDGAFADCNSLKSIQLPPVTEKIGKEAFARCKQLKQIEIPEHVKGIGGAAFAGCENLSFIKVDPKNKKYCSTAGGVLYSKDGKYVLQYPAGKEGNIYTVPPGVIRIGTYSFAGSTKLEKITIPPSCTSIGYGAFYECSNLKSITLPEALEKIDEDLFYGCAKLDSITVPQKVQKIGPSAFNGCTSLKNITITDNVTEIGVQAFSNCTSLRKVNLPKRLKQISKNSFAFCTSLQDINMPSDLEEIDDAAFAGDSSLTHISLPSNINKIGANAFGGCTNLQTVILPQNIKQICDAAFYNCKKMQDITLPAGTDSVGMGAFAGCENLATITIEGTLPPRATIVASYSISDTVLLKVKEGAEDTFHNALGWKEFQYINKKFYPIKHIEPEPDIASTILQQSEGANEENMVFATNENKKTQEPEEDTNIYKEDNVNETAQFTGGNNALKTYLSQSMKPQKSNVILSFVVEKNGDISNIEVIKSGGDEIDAECVSTLFAMPQWTPAVKNGRKVRQEAVISLPQ